VPSPDPILSHVIPYVLVFARLSGIFLTAPLLSGVAMPFRIKALLALMLAGAVYPFVPHTAAIPPDTDLFGLAPLFLAETVIGFTIGMVAAVPGLCMEASGVLMGQSVGFGLARVYNPEADFEVDILGQLLFYIAAGAFIACGGLESLFRTLLITFENVPVGAFTPGSSPLELFVGTLASGMQLAIRVAFPVLALVLLIVVVLGLLTKTIPQINVMTVGFTMKILAALGIVTVSLPWINDAVAGEVGAVMKSVLLWAREIR
jgi:flagellar biosynthetic protein FliR